MEPTPFTHVSGYSNRYKELLKYLSDAGDHVEVVTPDDSKDPPQEYMGYPISYTPGFRFTLYNHICLSIDYKLVGAEMIKRHKPEILHVTTPGFIAIISSIYAKIFNIPLVLTYHTHLPVYAEKYLGFVPFIVPITWFVVKYVHAAADLTLVTSPQLKAEFDAHGIDNVDVWRKGIDTVSFNPKWKDQATRDMLSDGNPDDLLLIYVGRLGKEKRIDDLRAVMDANPSVRLAIVGTGPYAEDLKKLFKGTKTVFTGMLSGEGLWRAFASADCFVMPSDSETLGFVVLESLASGVPVIAARAGGIPDLISEGETGFLVRPGATVEFSACIQRLQADPDAMRAMGQAGREEAEKWSWEKATSVLRNVQYPRAIENLRDDPRRSSSVRRFVNILSLSLVGTSAATIVQVGSWVDKGWQALFGQKQ